MPYIYVGLLLVVAVANFLWGNDWVASPKLTNSLLLVVVLLLVCMYVEKDTGRED